MRTVLSGLLALIRSRLRPHPTLEQAEVCTPVGLPKRDPLQWILHQQSMRDFCGRRFDMVLIGYAVLATGIPLPIGFYETLENHAES